MPTGHTFKEHISAKLLQALSEAGVLIETMGQRSFEGVQLLKEAVGEKVDDFTRYVESEDFEHDLDDLGTRLGFTSEQLNHRAEAHWSRVNHKLMLIGRHAALETVLPLTVLASAGKMSLGKRLRSQAGKVFAGANVLRIAFHCYQVFSARRAAGRVKSV